MHDEQLERHLRRQRLVRWGVYLGIPTLCLMMYFVVWAWPGQPVELKIGRRTTYLAGPQRDDGTIDYVAAMNARGADIPHKQNAAALLVRDIGLSEEPATVAQQYYDYFDVAPPGPDAVFMPWKDFQATLPDGQRPKDPDAVLDAVTRAPWRAADHPAAAAWLARNAEPIARFIKASQRPEMFWPYVVEDPQRQSMLLEVALPSSRLRDLSRLVDAWSMNRLAEGDRVKAREGIEAVFRLGMMYSRRAVSVCHLVGIAMVREGLDPAASWLRAHPDVGELNAMRAMVAALPEYDVDPAINGERFVVLDVVQQVMLRGYTGSRALDEAGISKAKRVYDVNRVLCRLNDIYDAMQRGDNQVNIDGQRVSVEAWLERQNRELQPLWRRVLLAVSPGPVRREAATEAITALFAAMFLPAFDRLRDIGDDAMARLHVFHVALRIETHYAKHGAYPADLADLADAETGDFADPYDDGLLGYRRMHDHAAKVWSIGPDGVDQGGVDDRPAGQPIGFNDPHDIVFLLGNVNDERSVTHD